MTARTQPDAAAARGLALRAVAQLGRRRRQLEDEIVETLQDAYDVGGLTWTDLGRALGVTGSVAWHLAHPSGQADEERLTG